MADSLSRQRELSGLGTRCDYDYAASVERKPMMNWKSTALLTVFLNVSMIVAIFMNTMVSLSPSPSASARWPS